MARQRLGPIGGLLTGKRAASRLLSRTRRMVPCARLELTSGECSGIEGRPTWYVNGVRTDRPFDVDCLGSAIMQQLGGRVR